MQAEGRAGSIVTLLCDDGRRYQTSCFDADWRRGQGLDCADAQAQVARWMDTGAVPEELQAAMPRAGALADPA
jgi:cysteine synthase A